MKKSLSINLIFLTLFISATSQSTIFLQPTPQDIEKIIDLDGSIAETDQRSLNPRPICATVSTSYLNIEFSNNLGLINVEISTSSGNLIYENNINTQTQSSVSIDMSDWESGVYQIHFEDSNGHYMIGTFEKE